MNSRISTLVFLGVLALFACASKEYPSDNSNVKYANRGKPGARLVFDDRLLVPDKVNVLYFYADW